MMNEGKGTKRRKVDGLSAPSDSVSLTSFTLKRVERNDDVCTKPRTEQNEASSKLMDVEKLQISLKLRPWIVFDQIINPEKFDMKDSNKKMSVENSLPKGVIRGCSSCNDCQKVIARWSQEEACRPVIDYAPVFHPTQEEFKNALEYIAKIRPKAEEYGICRIVPPDSWRPPSLVKENKVWESSRFRTHVQQIDELQTLHSKRELNKIIKRVKGNKRNPIMESVHGCDGFKPQSGPDFTLQKFKTYADHFKGQYFRKKDIFTAFRTPPWENIEGEYWRVVQNPTEQIQVLSGHNLDAKVFGSGFSLDDQSEYTKSGWNLNNTPKLPGSLLAFEDSDGSAPLTPRVDAGMCFSSISWKVEEHCLCLLSYMHLGASRIWYGIPGKYYHKCEEVLKKTFPELSQHPELFHKVVSQVSPATLKSEGIPVYRCVQHPKQFVLIFPGAYHSGLDSGFSVSEKVNLAPLNWLPFGQLCVETYSETRRKTSISYDKMLMEGARCAVEEPWKCQLEKDSEQWKIACGKTGWFTRALKARLKAEKLKLEFLCDASRVRKMDQVFVPGRATKRECVVCLRDLYFCAAACPCSPDRFSCLEHSKQTCVCAWSCRFFLIRYDMAELALLVDALEGKPDAVQKWKKRSVG